MEKLLLLGAFLLIRYFLTASFKKKKNAPRKTPKKAKTNKNLDDILGDFMKQLENKNQAKTQPVAVNTDNHKAEADTHKKLDWQKVTTSKFKDNTSSIERKDYNFSNLDSDEQINTIELYEDENENSFDLGKIDLRKAVLYKEILDRKYFTI